MRDVTDGLLAASVTCLQRVASQIRRMPSVDPLRPADLEAFMSTDAWSAETTPGNDVIRRLAIGARVSETARTLLAKVRQGGAGVDETVRVVRTAPMISVRLPRQRRTDNITVREVILPLPLMVMNRGVAILEGPADVNRDGGLVVVRDDARVASLVACHDLVWSVTAGEPYVPEESLPPYLEELLHELAVGSTDAQAAHNLHISHRTVSRHVAELLLALGAHSRLQAGVLAARAGIV